MSEYIVDVGDADEEYVAYFKRKAEMMMGNPIREKIVRCRDCKHFTPKGTHKFENGKVNADYCTYVRGWMLQITPDGFCAWAERKDGSNG